MDIYVVLFLVLAAEFVNGWTDAPNAIATVVSTRVLASYKAVLMASVLNILGAMSGTAVAVTIGTGIVDPSVIDLTTVAAAMVGIVCWSTLAWYYGLPTMVIELASRMGIPLSTTHTINTAIMGVGSSRRLSAVRWGVAGDIVAAWIFSTPARLRAPTRSLRQYPR